jgi:hypothetical protein
VPESLRSRAREALEQARPAFDAVLEMVSSGDHPFLGLKAALKSALLSKSGGSARAWVEPALEYGDGAFLESGNPADYYVVDPRPRLRFPIVESTADSEGPGRDFRDTRAGKYAVEFMEALGFAPGQSPKQWRNGRDSTTIADLGQHAISKIPAGASPVRELSALFTHGALARQLFENAALQPLVVGSDTRQLYLAFAGRVFDSVLAGKPYPDELYELVRRVDNRTPYGLKDALLDLMVLPVSAKQGAVELKKLQALVDEREKQGPVPQLGSLLYIMRKHGF